MKEDSWYARNREQALARAKEYREKNKDRYNIYYRNWYNLNKDELYARRKAAYVPKPKPKKEKQKREETVVFLPLSSPPPPPPPEILPPEAFIVKFD